MLGHLDNLLRAVLLERVEGLRIPANDAVDGQQVLFQAPDDEWLKRVKALQRNALNVYLADIRENRKLRSNERFRESEGGAVYDTPAPSRLDCHYLISAWSPAEVTQQTEPVIDEHNLLHQVAAVLFQLKVLSPSHIYGDDSAAVNQWPERFRDVELPMQVAPSDGFNKLAEFWGSMGSGARWRPAVYLIVTVPVALVKELSGPMVTTRITEYRQSGHAEAAEVSIQIGGHILNKDGEAVSGAWVRLETQDDEPIQTTETDELGRFTFSGLERGSYRLHARAVGLGDVAEDIEVPSPADSYDLRYA